jgi:hypothetical protein
MKPEKIKALHVGGASAPSYKGQRPGWIQWHLPVPVEVTVTAMARVSSASPPTRRRSPRFKCLSCGASGDLTDLLLDIQCGPAQAP